MDLDDVDAERPHHRLKVRAFGRPVRLRDPRTVSWRAVAAGTGDRRHFLQLLVYPDSRALVAALPDYRMRHLVRTYRTHYGLCATPADDQRLAGLLARYGQAIERDLLPQGLDLHELWQQRRWRRLLNVIDALPRNSHFVEALSDDEQLAEHLLDRPPAGAGRLAASMSQFSPELEMATHTYDRLGELIQAVTAAAGGKPPKIPAYPRPRTAADRIRKRRARAQHRNLVARLLPHGPQPAPPRPPARRGGRAAGDPVSVAS
ncbi:hypothetical protein [Actinoplanes sp. NPDC026623]|uniref:hypothetical protein n=1 Tax=Actinoplanes sp. NPDC026623 TaxID=3155610 RepID=UPI0033DFD5B2